jgi:hypothetical protein
MFKICRLTRILHKINYIFLYWFIIISLCNNLSEFENEE